MTKLTTRERKVKGALFLLNTIMIQLEEVEHEIDPATMGELAVLIEAAEGLLNRELDRKLNK